MTLACYGALEIVGVIIIIINLAYTFRLYIWTELLFSSCRFGLHNVAFSYLDFVYILICRYWTLHSYRSSDRC